MSRDSKKTSNETDAPHSDGEDDEGEVTARRKALSSVVPMAVGAFIKAQGALSPLSMASKAAGAMDVMAQEQVASLNSFLKKKLPELQCLNLASEGPGLYSFTATREAVLSAVVSQYLRLNLREDSAFVFPFHVFPPSQEALDAESYDCQLSLAPGSVFGRLIEEKPKPTIIISLQSRAISANPPNEIWLFVTSGLKKSEEADFLMDSVFATEKKFLPGRIMVVGLNTVFAEVFGNDPYTVQSVKMETRTDEQNATIQVFKATLLENTAQSQGERGVTAAGTKGNQPIRI